MDEWDFLDEVDVLAKWPDEHKKVIAEGGKWSERRDALEALNKIMEADPRLATTSMTIYGQLMDELRKILDRESNIAVVVAASRSVELLAKGLRTKFAGFVGMVFPFLIKRAKDKKKNVRDAVASALDAVALTTTAERLQKDLLEGFALPSPEVKQTLLEFIYKYCKSVETVDIQFYKAVTPVIVKMASDSDVGVREKACAALGSIRRVLGAALVAFLAPIAGDETKMAKVAQYEKQATDEWELENAERAKQRPQAAAAADDDGQSRAESDSTAAVNGSHPASIDPWTLMDAVDVTAKLPNTIETQLADKAWKERLDACTTLKNAVDAAGRVEISDRTRELAAILVKIIEKDVNVNVAACAANVLSGLAVKSRLAFAGIAAKVFPVAFDKLKDKKVVLRDALNELVDSAAATTSLGGYTEALNAGLASKNPLSRSQTAAFLARVIAKNDSTTIDVAAIKELVECICKSANDADKDVREATLLVVAATCKCVGDNVARRIFAEIFDDKLKADRIPALVEELVKEFGKTATDEMKRLAAAGGGVKGVGSSASAASSSASVAAGGAGRPATSSSTSTAKKFVARPVPPSSASRSAPKAAATTSTTRAAPIASTPQRQLPRVATPARLPATSRTTTGFAPKTTTRPASAAAALLANPGSIAFNPVTPAQKAAGRPFVAVTSKINNAGTSLSGRPSSASKAPTSAAAFGKPAGTAPAAKVTVPPFRKEKKQKRNIDLQPTFARPKVVATTGENASAGVKATNEKFLAQMRSNPLRIPPSPSNGPTTSTTRPNPNVPERGQLVKPTPSLPAGRLPSVRQHSLTKFDPLLQKPTGIPAPAGRQKSFTGLEKPFGALKVTNGDLGPL